MNSKYLGKANDLNRVSKIFFLIATILPYSRILKVLIGTQLIYNFRNMQHLNHKYKSFMTSKMV
jgi:hypothetical protein